MNGRRPSRLGISFLMLATLIFAPALCPPRLVAHQANTYTLGGMHIGDELKAFIKRFPESYCHRRHSDAVEKTELRREWLEWIDCGSDRSVLGSDDALAAIRLSGGSAQVYATFFHKRLVSVEYLFADVPYDLVLSAYIKKYGVPQARAEDGLSLNSAIAVWSRPCCRLQMEEISLFTTVDSLGRLCIEKAPRAKAVRLRLTSLLSDEMEFMGDTK